jgi:glycosyltransferase involved in cell wall biosynthesis
MVGRLRSAKGADLFVKAIELLPQVDAILIGNGDERPLVERLIEGMKAPNRLTWLPAGDPLAAMAAADVVVVPSRHEGLGLVALEAMSIERPVVAARIGGLVEVVEDGVTGLLVSPESPEAIAGAVTELLDDPAAARAMGRAGRLRVADKFSLRRMTEAYDRIYQTVAM